MLVIAGIIRIDPQNRSVADAAFDKMRAATLKEPGCIDYQAYADRNDPGVFFMFEKWETPEALAKHFQTPHMAEFNAIPQLIAGPPSINRSEVSAVTKLM